MPSSSDTALLAMTFSDTKTNGQRPVLLDLGPAGKVFGPLSTPDSPPATSGEVRVVDPETGGAKGEKPERFDLLPWDALEEVARVYHYGASKYDDHNWARGYRWSLSIGACFRHLARFVQGEDRDKESGCLHMAHAAFHCLTLIAYALRVRGTDDRWKP